MSGVLYTGDPATIPISRREAARYLGVRGNVPSEAEALFDSFEKDLRVVMAPKALCGDTTVEIEGDTVTLSFCTIESAALAKNLAGCRRAVVFAATLGVGVDRLLLRLEKTDPAGAAVFDALASAAAEGWCNELNETLSSGRNTRPRFSPGYGGVALCHQADFLRFLDAQRKLGLSLSDRFFMTPVKSVTAIIGILEEPT